MGKRFAFAAATACGLAAVTAVVAAPPAQAARPTVTIATPLQGALLSDPVMHITGEARMPSGGTVTGELRIDVESLDGRGVQGVATNVNDNPVPFNWDYTTTFNGRYAVIVTAQGRDGPVDTTPSEQTVQRVEVSVEVKPAPPGNVRADDNSAREVVVKWDPNKEPDMLGYQVQRMHEDDDEWVAAGNSTATTFTDKATTSKGGQYKYRVVGIRSGAVAGSGIASDPSSVKTVEVADPPGATTTTAGGGGGTGGTGGGSSGGSTGGSAGSGGSSGGGTGGSTGGSAGAGSGSALATTGKVDLSGFAGLLADARTDAPGAARSIGSGRPGEEDGGFGETLPFKPGEAEPLGEDGTALAIGVEEAGDDGGQKPIAFVAASLLVTVILMHVLWLKREVDKVPLEAITE